MKFGEYLKLRMKGQNESVNSDGKSEKMSFSWWLKDNSDGDNPDYRRLKKAFKYWNILNWMILYWACEIVVLMRHISNSRLWVDLKFLTAGELLKGIKMVPAIVGLAFGVWFLNLALNTRAQTEEDDMALRVSNYIAIPAAVNFMFSVSWTPIVIAVVAWMMIRTEKRMADKNRSYLNRTTPTAKVTRITLPDQRELTIVTSNEKEKGGRHPH